MDDGRRSAVALGQWMRYPGLYLMRMGDGDVDERIN
jgi:hypothetical protein